MREVEVLSPFTVDHPSPKVSSKYLFVPTSRVIEAMADHGWVVNSQACTKTEKEERRGYVKHMLRFRPANPANEIRMGDSIAEVLTVNSHDATTSWRAQGGVWRIVCGNGLIVSEVAFPGVVARHHGDLDSIIRASLEVADRLPILVGQVNKFKAKSLTPLRQLEFAKAAAHIRYDGKDVVDAKDLLKVNRVEDEPTDLWTTFNKVQENLSRGGQVGQVGETGMFRRMRPIGGMNKTIDTNTKLWDLALAYV